MILVQCTPERALVRACTTQLLLAVMRVRVIRVLVLVTLLLAPHAPCHERETS